MTNQPGNAPEVAPQTWMPTTAGILAIVAGVSDVLLGIISSAWGTLVGMLSRIWGLGALGVPLIILGIVAIIGGTFALQRKAWGMALAGAICAIWPPLSTLGLLSVIFVALSKREFA